MDCVPILFCETVINHLFVNRSDEIMLYYISKLAARCWSQAWRFRGTVESIEVEIYEDAANSLFKCYFYRTDTDGVFTFNEMKHLTRDWKQIEKITFDHITRCYEDDPIYRNKDFSVSPELMMEEVCPYIASQRTYRELDFQTLEPSTLDGFLSYMSPDAAVEILKVVANNVPVDSKMITFIDSLTKTQKLEALILYSWPFRPDEWMLRLFSQKQFYTMPPECPDQLGFLDVDLLHALLREFQKRPFNEETPTISLMMNLEVEKIRTVLVAQAAHWQVDSESNCCKLFLPDSDSDCFVELVLLHHEDNSCMINFRRVPEKKETDVIDWGKSITSDEDDECDEDESLHCEDDSDENQ